MTDTPDISPGDRARIAKMKERAAIWSIVASIVLTLGKAVGAWLSGSLALASEAMHGLIDIAATTTTWFAIRAADKPADDDHHYGHGKVESLAALAESALLFALAGAVAWEAVSRLWGGGHPSIEVTPLVIGILLVAILIDGTRWRALHAIARDTNSEALAADAMHFASDFVSSALTLAGLIAVMAGVKAGDAIAALGVSIFIVGAAMRLAARTIKTPRPRGCATGWRKRPWLLPEWRRWIGSGSGPAAGAPSAKWASRSRARCRSKRWPRSRPSSGAGWRRPRRAAN